MVCRYCGLIKGSVLRLLLKVGIIASLLALAVLAFPISTAAAHPREPQLVFRVDPSLREPKILQVYGPPQPAPKPVIKPAPKKKTEKVALKPETRKTKFAPGQCTDYVARRVPVTWRGNANRWDDNARAQGYVVDKNPVAGAILVTNESRAGHVAYIESVDGSKVTFSEWNVAGRYKLTTRTLDITDRVIVGVIHVQT